MKRMTLLVATFFLTLYPFVTSHANEPDSAFIFAYATEKNQNHNGLHFAWSIDKKSWHPIGPEYAFVRSDYSRWGSEKRMIDPVLLLGPDGKWHAVWTLNDRVGAFAYAKSSDLVRWMPQSYPVMSEKKNCLSTEVTFANGLYTISWLSANEGERAYYAVTTADFKNYSEPRKIEESQRVNQRTELPVAGNMETGTVHRVPWSLVDALQKKVQLAEYQRGRNNEMMRDDKSRFAGLKPVEAKIAVLAENSKKISENLLGIFFEDINYAADGGIYAELIQNRGFEYKPSDRGNDREWNAKKAWSTVGEASFEIETSLPIHENNLHYALLKADRPGSGLQNEGFGGIVLKAGEKYDFSLFARIPDGKGVKLKVCLTDEDGSVLGETSIRPGSKEWKKFSSVITANRDTKSGRLRILLQSEGAVALDMISLFPQKTFNGRKNGLRNDLAQILADMKPRFVRFPGGCVAHGDGIGNIYNWKNSVGPLEARKPQRNIWGYHQSMGLGYFEYFQFCEDIGAEPLPIVAAGVPCQNSGHHHGYALGGQQGGIPMCDMEGYVQDILDLVEWANGDPKVNKWAKMRTDAGHPKPFNLKYIGVGNEDLISDVFEERFAMIFNALKEKYPEITVIGTAGPFSEGSDYERGWDFATELGVPMLDEHYYQPPGWFIHNQDYYDRYDRSEPKVYLGEYAAHLPGRPVNIETALLEALHLINIERNGDIVELTSYAPLLAKEGNTQWNPDLIYFNNSEVKPTVGYYVQKLFGTNSGNEYISSHINLSDSREAVIKRVACSVVRHGEEVIVKLVNLLPVEVKTNLDIASLNISGGEVLKTELCGTPDDRMARPEESRIQLSDLNELTIQPYSFTVLRIYNQ